MDKDLPIPEQADRFRILERLRTDPRFTNGHSSLQARDLIEALYWADWAIGDVPKDERRKALDQHVSVQLGGAYQRSGWSGLIRDDLPRWEPDGFLSWQSRRCEHVLASGPRRGEACGKSSQSCFRVTDPNSGEWRVSHWCSKHLEGGKVLQKWHRARDKSGDPRPAPNRGGVLPCYLDTSVEGGWVEAYRKAAQPGWFPPEFGVVADDWPLVMQPEGPRPKLRLVLGGLLSGG